MSSVVADDLSKHFQALIMNSKHLWYASAVLVLLTSVACSGSDDDSTKGTSNDIGADTKDAEADALPTECTPIDEDHGTANPATWYCLDMGYTVAEETCLFPDGTQCGDWDFFRGQCGQAHSFCELHGGTVAYEEVKVPATGGTAGYAVCTLPNGNRCGEQDFMHTCACEKTPF